MKIEAIERLRHAYKKLKASVYYDKTQTILRKQIAEFESDGDVEIKLIKMALEIYTNHSNYLNEILSKITVVSFPKKISGEDSKKGNVIINAPSRNLKIDSCNYFSNLPVEGHILGTLWVMEIGSVLDRDVYDRAFGNRLRDEFSDEKKKGNHFSPYLFKYYFEEYESWWNNALDSAKETMKKEKDAVIMCLDLSRFFYSVTFSEDEFKAIFKKYEDEVKQFGSDALSESTYCYNFMKPINDFVFNVLSEYGKIMHPIMPETVKDDNKQCLPLGFLPSSILSNYKLKEIDSAILDRLNPIYYGRYVDDILIVLSLESASKIRNKVKEDTTALPSTYILELFLKKERQSSKNRIHIVNEKKEGSNEKEYVFHINNKRTNFKINYKKIQCFYFFFDRTDSLIDAFKRHISRNVSAFNLMPREDPWELEQIDQIYNLKMTESTKFRGIENIELSRFELSKLVGKQMITSNITGEHTHRFLKDSLKIFDEFNILNNYSLWENMFAYYIINEKPDHIIEFTKSIFRVLSEIKYEIRTFEKTYNVISTLKEHYISSISRALSIILGKEATNFIKKMKDELSRLDTRINWFRDDISSVIEYDARAFYESAMFDKRLVPIFMAKGIHINATDSIRLNKLEDIVELYKSSSFNEIDANKYRFYPYMISPFDIKLVNTLLRMISGEATISGKSDWDQTSRQYCSINFDKNSQCDLLNRAVESIDFLKNDDEPKRKYSITRIGREKQKELRIAIANTNAIKDSLENVMRDKTTKTKKRYDDLAEIVNQAIRGSADILILPETYVPFEWLKLLSKKSVDNDLAIITGVEHLKFNGGKGQKIYNLTATILPFKGEIYKYPFLEFHNKVHYSPAEVETIHGFRGDEVKGNSYELFIWKDVWIAPYCCYEITSIHDRSLFQSLADLIVVVECNRDVNYFGSIMESLSRDLHCFCAQVNSSKYGDSRITQPTETERRDIVRTKGGKNHTVIIETIEVANLRDFQLKEHNLQSKGEKKFKQTPPDFKKEQLEMKIKGTLFDSFNSNDDVNQYN